MPIDFLSWGWSAVKTVAGPAWRFFHKPRLKVTASAADPFIKHTETALAGMNVMNAMERKWLSYYRLKVTNKGREQAQGCRVLITNIQHVVDGQWRDIPGWEPVTLKWSLRGVPSVDISPKEEAFCDIGHVASNYIQNNVYPQNRPRGLGRTDPNHHAWLFLETDRQPNHQAGKLAYGDYCLRLRLVTNNTGTTDVALYLRFMGQFAFMMADIPEGTIFEVPTRAPEVGTMFHARG